MKKYLCQKAFSEEVHFQVFIKHIKTLTHFYVKGRQFHYFAQATEKLCAAKVVLVRCAIKLMLLFTVECITQRLACFLSRCLVFQGVLIKQQQFEFAFLID